MPKGKSIQLITVGKIRSKHWKEASEYYLKMISRWQNIICIEVRDSEPTLTNLARKEQEAECILAKFDPRDYLIALSENGESLSSLAFAEYLEKLDRESGKLCFIIGGPFGLADKILQRSRRILSLSPMTFPHELARVLLLEQIFRANCIRYNFPYHH